MTPDEAAPEPAPVDAPAPPPPPTVEPEARATIGVAAAAPVEPEDVRPPPPDPIVVGGYLQPQLRFRQDSAAQQDEDGFRVRRARLTAKAHQHVGSFEAGANVEVELTPDFQMVDGFVWLSHALGDGDLKLDLGQVKVPVSRQAMLSDSALGFVEKADLATLAPDRQIGARLSLALPQAPWVRLSGGIFDGDGRNQPGNNDQKFLFAGRLELAPIGRQAPLAESAMNGTVVVAGASIARNNQDIGDGTEATFTLGGDLFAAWQGLSGGVEYLWVHHTFEGSAQPAYHANGVAAHAAYLIPSLGSFHDMFEVGARYEASDHNDEIAIEQAGDPNQSLQTFTLAASMYLRGHSLKVQATASHTIELEDRDRNNSDATYDNGTVLVQLTYRLE